jgi:hypothetical protein
LLIFTGHGYAGESSSKGAEILQKMTTTLESAQSLSVQAVATVDEIEPADDFKVQKTFTIDMRFKRPDKLFAVKSGDENQRAYFDGKTFTVVNPVTKKYGQESLLGTTDDLIVKLDQLNVEAPLADLLLSNLTDVVKKNVQKVKYIGVSRIGGEECDHIVVRTAVADWQLWISQAQQATLCKSVITTRSLAQGPQYEVTFSGWKINGEIDENSFVAQIPADTVQIPLAPGAFRYAL